MTATATSKQPETIAQQIADRLVRQGRTSAEANHDACRWVRENLGITVNIAGAADQPANDPWIFCDFHQAEYHVDFGCIGCMDGLPNA